MRIDPIYVGTIGVVAGLMVIAAVIDYRRKGRLSPLECLVMAAAIAATALIFRPISDHVGTPNKSVDRTGAAVTPAAAPLIGALSLTRWQ